MNKHSSRCVPSAYGRPGRRPGGRAVRLLATSGLTCAAVLSPTGAQSSQAAAHDCPAHALCLYPGAGYQGTARILSVPRDPFEKGQWSDDGHCLRLPVGSLIDNTVYGGTVYANDQCDNSGDTQDFARGGRIAKFTDWKVRSFIYPFD